MRRIGSGTTILCLECHSKTIKFLKGFRAVKRKKKTKVWVNNIKTNNRIRKLFVNKVCSI